jgi:cysteine-rich repeat protein
MRGARSGAFAVVALVVASGCPFDSSGSGSGAASIGDSSGTSSDPSTTTSDPTSGSVDDTTAPGTDETDGGCPPGTIGCACEDATCDAGLECKDGLCAAANCGDGVLDPPEECDDDNEIVDDGCENDCTVSPGAAGIATGGDHTCVVTFDGRVRCWGAGEDGRTGQGNTLDLGDDEHPSDGVDLPFPGPVRAIGLGDGFGCALLRSGEVMCWGRNTNGRLGLGNDDPSVLDDRVDVLMPVELDVASTALAVGREHACVVQEGGAVRCWGAGGKGRLGYGVEAAMAGNDVGDDELANDLDPVQIGGQAVALTAGVEHTCALLVSGEVRCWGAHAEGRLGVPDVSEDIGDNEDPESIAAVGFGGLVARAVVADGHHTCAIVGDEDELWCWGQGDKGRLGTGAVDDVSEPVKIETGGRTLAVDLGDAHTCVVLDDVVFREAPIDQAVRCFGEGAVGKLGTGMTADLGHTPETVPDLLPPIDVLGSARRRISSVAAGVAHTCVRMGGGFVRCWGEGTEGRLGYNSAEKIGDNEAPSVAGDVMFE